jgi:hypothetical protein
MLCASAHGADGVTSKTDIKRSFFTGVDSFTDLMLLE